MATKSVIGMRVIRSESNSHGFHSTFLNVELIPLRWHDYTKEMLGWLHNESIHNSLREKALACKRATDQTSVLVHQDTGRNSVEVRWQGYKYRDDDESQARWIAPRIDACYFDEASQKVLKKVAGTMAALGGSEAQPADFIKALQVIGALLVRYNNEADGYLPLDEFDLEELCSAAKVRA